MAASESHQLEHLYQGKAIPPIVTGFYCRASGGAFALPVVSWPVGLILRWKPDCNVATLTWFVGLSLLVIVLWSLDAFTAIQVGVVATSYYL